MQYSVFFRYFSEALVLYKSPQSGSVVPIGWPCGGTSAFENFNACGFFKKSPI